MVKPCNYEVGQDKPNDTFCAASTQAPTAFKVMQIIFKYLVKYISEGNPI